MTKAEKLKKKQGRDREATQKRLLEAATRVFASYGYKGATTKAIAKEAGVAEALIQRYFNGKQGLFMALMNDFTQGEKSSCAELPPKAATFDQEWRNILTHAVNHCAEKKDHLSAAISQATFDRNFGKGMAKFLESDRAPVLIARFKQHQKDGTLPANADVEALAYGLALTMLGIGHIGQNIMKLDPKLLERVVQNLSKAHSAK